MLFCTILLQQILLSLPRHAANYCSSRPGPGFPFSVQSSLTPSQCVRKLGLCNKAPPSQRRTTVTGYYCSVVSQLAQLVWTGLAGWAHAGVCIQSAKQLEAGWSKMSRPTFGWPSTEGTGWLDPVSPVTQQTSLGVFSM